MLSAPAFARTTLNTSMMFVPLNDSEECNVVNVGAKPVTLTISITTGDGVVLMSASTTVAPGTGEFLQDDIKSLVYCSFLLSNGSAKDVRGSLGVVDSSGTSLAALPAN